MAKTTVNRRHSGLAMCPVPPACGTRDTSRLSSPAPMLGAAAVLLLLLLSLLPLLLPKRRRRCLLGLIDPVRCAEPSSPGQCEDLRDRGDSYNYRCTTRDDQHRQQSSRTRLQGKYEGPLYHFRCQDSELVTM